jgi:hypothetical protein
MIESALTESCELLPLKEYLPFYHAVFWQQAEDGEGHNAFP